MKAIYPGTFDPLTLGHLDIAKRAAKLCSHLVIAVGNNPQKKCLFSQKERISLWQQVISLPHVEVLPFNALLVDFAEQQQCTIIFRAIRNHCDYENELLQSQANRLLSGIETLYLTVDEKYRMISSTLVKEIANFGRSLEAFIPQEIEQQVFQKIHTRNNTLL